MQHFQKIVVEVTASGQHMSQTGVGVKQGHGPCKIFLLQQRLFLCQLNFFKILRLSHY